LKRSEQRYGGKKETFDVAAKETAIGNGAARGNLPDDLKSAAGEIFNSTRQILQLVCCGNDFRAFPR
jgi:hypothetical protein